MRHVGDLTEHIEIFVVLLEAVDIPSWYLYIRAGVS